MCTRGLLMVILLVGLLLPGRMEAVETDVEQVASKLLATTVTVRIAPADGAARAADPNHRPASASGTKRDKPATVAADGVTVCSGVSLGKGLILTFGRLPHATAQASNDQTYRVTLPGGEQAAAKPRVIDAYSGLVLLKVGNEKLPGLELAEELPPIGGMLLTAAASGIEKPLVSMGILSGVDRTVGGTNLPPLLQCDVRTTDASSGAAIVDKHQRLVGVIAATGILDEKFGWSYAVPVRFVRRVLDAQVDARQVVLVRRRPTVGLTLGPGPVEGSVRVERIVPGGPADRAGIRAGDIVVEAEGRKIRSAYQAVALILNRLPGEKFSFCVEQDGKSRDVEVTLEGGATVVAPLAEAKTPAVQVGPQLNLRVAGPNRLELRNRAGVQELSVRGTETPQRSLGNEVELLRAQLTAYQKVIVAMQKELKLRQGQQEQTERDLAGLRKQVADLQEQLEAAKK